MAYQFKYYKNFNEWRLEIHQDTEESLTAMEIGSVLQSIRLNVQGEQADIDTPIVKTSLEMTFVDAPDLDETRKCGYWNEFYTSSSTEFLVRLFKNGKAEWSGYITPDSFSESLQYRGSVTIIARDNLGTLQDFEFDAASSSSYGLISLSEIITKGLRKVSFPMAYTLTPSDKGAGRLPLTSESNTPSVYDILFNISSFQGKTWQEAIESVLTATGLVMRYVGRHSFKVMAIRDIPLCGKDYWWDVPVKDTIFCAYGQRELSPAAKSIVEEVKFEIEENFAENNMPAEAYGEAGSYGFLTDSEDSAEHTIIYSMPLHSVVGGSWDKREVANSLFLDPFAFPLKEGYSSRKKGDLRDTSVVYIAANDNEGASQTTRNALWSARVGAGKYKFSFKADNPIALYDDNTKVGHIDQDVLFTRFRFFLRYQSKDGTELMEYRTSSNSWVSGWSSNANSLFPNEAFPITYEFPELEVSSVGTIQFVITYVGVTKKLGSPAGISKGAYVAFKEFELTDANLENTPIVGSQKITTNYNAKNNILIQRKVDYGFNDGNVASPQIIKNGMFINKNEWYDSSDSWKFNMSDVGNPLPVLIHQQLLAYYSKPNNILSGELATNEPLFSALYEWKGRKHILTSGTLNLLTGRMEGATLREFTRYDHMWETWIEGDVIELGAEAATIEIVIHTNKELQPLGFTFPYWLIMQELRNNGDGTYSMILDVAYNDTDTEREHIVKVDSAMVLLRQQKIEPTGKDYGIDYGEDYS